MAAPRVLHGAPGDRGGQAEGRGVEEHGHRPRGGADARGPCDRCLRSPGYRHDRASSLNGEQDAQVTGQGSRGTPDGAHPHRGAERAHGGDPRDRAQPRATAPPLRRRGARPARRLDPPPRAPPAAGRAPHRGALRADRRPAITNTLRLLGLPDVVKAQLESGELTAGHARAVLAIEGVTEQVSFAREIVTRGLTKSETERLAAARRARQGKQPAGGRPTDVHLRGLAEELTRGLGTRARITRHPRGGSIEIEFYSDAELDRLIDRLRQALPRA